jgi:hypothetical protein
LILHNSKLTLKVLAPQKREDVDSHPFSYYFPVSVSGTKTASAERDPKLLSLISTSQTKIAKDSKDTLVV